MASLSPQGRTLIEAGRRALRATPADRARVESALRAQLGADALPHEGPAAPLPPRAGVPFVAKAVVAACLVAGAALVALLPRASTPARPAVRAPAPASAPQMPALDAPQETRAPETSATPFVAPAASAPPSAASVPRRQDRLAQEVALLSRATQALRLGRAEQALHALELHERRFPSGSLAEERRGAKAQALCLLGRAQEGRVALRQLDPRSPAAARATQVCAEAATSAKTR